MSETSIPQAFWAVDANSLLAKLNSSPAGLDGAEASRQLQESPNDLGSGAESEVHLLLHQFESLLILLLLGAAAISMVLTEPERTTSLDLLREYTDSAIGTRIGWRRYEIECQVRYGSCRFLEVP